MSQVKFNAPYKGGTIEVMAGYDRPLSGFFLTIFELVDSDEEMILYSSLDDQRADQFGQFDDTMVIRDVLEAYVPNPPAGFWELVEKREGNVVHVLSLEGDNNERIVH
jgi:hypothetical protein